MHWSLREFINVPISITCRGESHPKFNKKKKKKVVCKRHTISWFFWFLALAANFLVWAYYGYSCARVCAHFLDFVLLYGVTEIIIYYCVIIKNFK